MVKRSRSEWANMDWQTAQKEVADMLNQFGFMTFEEKRLKSSRTDVMVIYQTTTSLTFGIVEVKAYNKATPGLEKKAFEQAIKYLRTWYKSIKSNSRWGKKHKKYFVATVFTKDYPVTFNNSFISKLINKLPKEIRKDTSFISTTPDSLINMLIKRNLILSKQGALDDFF